MIQINVKDDECDCSLSDVMPCDKQVLKRQLIELLSWHASSVEEACDAFTFPTTLSLTMPTNSRLFDLVD